MLQFKTYPTSVPLNVGVSPEDGQIIDVGPYRHRVDWVGSGPSQITYCNWCGDALILSGKLKAGPEIGVCSKCHNFMGWEGDPPEDWSPLDPDTYRAQVP